MAKAPSTLQYKQRLAVKWEDVWIDHCDVLCYCVHMLYMIVEMYVNGACLFWPSECWSGSLGKGYKSEENKPP